MYQKLGKKKALQLDPVEFETMKSTFYVDCQFFRAVENSDNLFKDHGVDTSDCRHAISKEMGYWKPSQESLEVLEDAKEGTSS